MSSAAQKYLLYIFLLVALYSILVMFPGSYSIDTVMQYWQTTTGNYNDWHSPVLPFLWGIIQDITGSIYSMYILQMIAYWYFIYLLLFKVAPRPLITIGGIIGASFAIFIPQYVMKDPHIIIAWGIACMMMIDLYRTPLAKGKYLKVAVAALLIWYGTALRISNLAASIFLFYLLADVGIPKATFLKKSIATVVLCIITVVSTQVFIYNVLHAQKTYPQYKLMLLDVVAISLKSGTDYIPADIKHEGYDLARLKKEYTPASIDDIYWPKNGATPMLREPYDVFYGLLKKSWWRAVSEHPGIYLANRWDGFLYYLRIKQRFAKSDYWDINIHITNNDYGITRTNWDITNKLFALHYWLHKHTFFFAPWFWLLLNTIIFLHSVITYRKTNNTEFKILAIMQLSGISLILSMWLVYQHDQDFRYTYWNMILVLIAFAHCTYLYTNRKKRPATTTDITQ